MLLRHLAACNISQNRWAQRLGISRSYLSMLLNGKRRYPGPELRQRLLKKLGLSFDELFAIEHEGEELPVPEKMPRTAVRTSPDPLELVPLKGTLMLALWEDLHFSIRLLFRNPGFLALSLLTLVVGIGANTAIFSFTNSLLWKPLPFPDSQELVFLNESQRELQRGRTAVSYLNFRDWQRSAKSFSGMAAYDTTALIIEASETLPRRIAGVAVSEDFFDVLQVFPEQGTLFGGGTEGAH